MIKTTTFILFIYAKDTEKRKTREMREYTLKPKLKLKCENLPVNYGSSNSPYQTGKKTTRKYQTVQCNGAKAIKLIPH